jgi:hypothetical protein
MKNWRNIWKRKPIQPLGRAGCFDGAIQVLATLHGYKPEELERIRAQKAKERGSFTKRLFLDEIRE